MLESGRRLWVGIDVNDNEEADWTEDEGDCEFGVCLVVRLYLVKVVSVKVVKTVVTGDSVQVWLLDDLSVVALVVSIFELVRIAEL